MPDYFWSQKDRSPNNENSNHSEHHNVTVIEELRHDAEFFDAIGHRTTVFLKERHIISIQMFKGGQLCQIDVEETVIRQSEESELQHAEKFESDNFAVG